jgi:chromosomal replication initiation ATPase DnaA
MKFDNPFLKHLAKKFEFNTLNEWADYIKDTKDKDNLNDIGLLIYELSKISGFTYDEIRGTSRKREIIEVKHIGRYIAYQNQLGSLNEIGYAFGGKHHSTVIHSRDFVDSMIEINQRMFMQNFKNYQHLIKSHLKKKQKN